MKKKIIPLILAIIVLGALLAVYFVGKHRESEMDKAALESSIANNYQEGADQTQYPILVKDPNSIERFVMENDGKEIEFYYNYDIDDWQITGYEGVELDGDMVASMVNIFSNLYSNYVITAENRADVDYGIENTTKKGTAYYSDGSTATILRGNLSGDKKYYYVQLEGQEDIYLKDTYTGDRFEYDILYFADTNIHNISQSTINYLNIKQEGKDEIEIEFRADGEKAADRQTATGLTTLTMTKPVEDVLVYPTNLQSEVLTTLDLMDVYRAVDLKPDLSSYGLDTPELEIEMRDDEGSLKLKIGDDNPDKEGYCYCLVDDKTAVFTIAKDEVEPFYDVDIYSFIEKFIALHNRIDIESVDIKIKGEEFKVEFKGDIVTEATTEATTEAEEVPEGETEETTLVNFRDSRTASINGKEIDDEAFITFMEALIGLNFDAVDKERTPEGTPEVEIVYNLLDGTTDSYKAYSYDANFYQIEKNGKFDKIANKSQFTSLLEKAKELTE